MDQFRGRIVPLASGTPYRLSWFSSMRVVFDNMTLLSGYEVSCLASFQPKSRLRDTAEWPAVLSLGRVALCDAIHLCLQVANAVGARQWVLEIHGRVPVWFIQNYGTSGNVSSGLLGASAHLFWIHVPRSLSGIIKLRSLTSSLQHLFVGAPRRIGFSFSSIGMTTVFVHGINCGEALIGCCFRTVFRKIPLFCSCPTSC